jgi:N-acetylglutamate synthase-like GNAT family acetyltransferase
VDDTSANIQVGLLADHPEHVATVAGWIYAQWLRGRPGMSLAFAEAKFRSHLQRDAIPTTLIALAEGTPIATASIYVDDLEERRDLGPWLAAVYVAPPWRRRGVGAQVVRATEGVARRLAIPQLFLFTPDQEHFYTQLGWAAIGQAIDHAEQVVVMQKMMI